MLPPAVVYMSILKEILRNRGMLKKMNPHPRCADPLPEEEGGF
jgi:hypothetical protein